jgi:hypothetical protein
MDELLLQKLFLLLRKPIPWDPIPWWVKLNKEQVTRFNEVQVKLNSKIADIEAQKIRELSKMAGLPMQ